MGSWKSLDFLSVKEWEPDVDVSHHSGKLQAQLMVKCYILMSHCYGMSVLRRWCAGERGSRVWPGVRPWQWRPVVNDNTARPWVLPWSSCEHSAPTAAACTAETTTASSPAAASSRPFSHRLLPTGNYH